MTTSSFLASFYLACGVVMFFLAVTILRQSGRNVVNWATASVLLFASAGPILGAIGVLLESDLRQGAILFQNLVKSFDYVWHFFFPSLVLFALVYPVRNRIWKYLKKYGFILFLPHIFHLVLIIFIIDQVEPAKLFKPLYGLSESSGVLDTFADNASRFLTVTTELLLKAHNKLFSIVNIAYAGFALILLGRSVRKDLSPRVRRQMSVMLAGLGLCVLTYSLIWVIPLFSGITITEDLSVIFINASLIIGGGAIAYSIVRHQFLDMRLIARKAIFYASAATLFASFYLLAVKGITRFFAQYSGGSVEIIETGLIILFFILFQPVVGRLEEWTERLLVREESRPRKLVRELSAELLSMIEIDEIKDRIRSVLMTVFNTNEVELVLSSEVLGQTDDDIYGGRVFEKLSRYHEPMQRLDFMEAMGFFNIKNRLFLKPSKRVINEAVETLPGIVRRFARFELLAPVIHEGHCIAVLLLGVRNVRGRYSMVEVAQITMLTSQIAAALSRIELLKEVVEKKVMEEELSLARTIQLNLLPSAPPILDHYEVSALSQSSKQVGGDYYDFIHVNGYLAVAVADVSGKGVPASLLMASLQASLRSTMDYIDDPIGVVSRLNNVMYGTTATDKFATMFYGCLDIKKHELDYTNAGHFFPVVIREGGEIEVLDYSGLILGVMEGYEYEDRKIRLRPGDTLVVTTDGVTEAEGSSGDMYGEKRLYELLSSLRGSSAEEIKQAIVDNVNEFSELKGVNDDLTILVLKRKE